VDALVGELKCETEDIHRPALTALANLSFRRGDVSERILGMEAHRTILALAASTTIQVVRESARCLSSLADCVGSRLDSDELRGVMRSVLGMGDSRARAHVQQLQRTLKITAI